MGSHFHHWIVYNGVSFSTEFLTESLEWGRKLLGFWLVGFKNKKICGQKLLQKEV